MCREVGVARDEGEKKRNHLVVAELVAGAVEGRRVERPGLQQAVRVDESLHGSGCGVPISGAAADIASSSGVLIWSGCAGTGVDGGRDSFPVNAARGTTGVG
jgi:hypothetical protein